MADWNVALDFQGNQKVISKHNSEAEAILFLESQFPAYYNEHDQIQIRRNILGITTFERTIVIKPNLAYIETLLSDRQLEVKSRLIEIEIYRQFLQICLEHQLLTMQEEHRMLAFANDAQQLLDLQEIQNQEAINRMETDFQASQLAMVQRAQQREIELLDLQHQIHLKRLKRESHPVLGRFWKWWGGK